ncbi:exo-alpha-sialidase [Flavobacterium sp. ANB]|uniref:sialidase family protein n=1 Tax=unclassified Flavobacterium TaxID=196869 RepID=UPI0012B7A002|nr:MULTISPECIES: sialidase family protein [unclassified Flavobacterium]MBF4517790.1 exo-alpha-sialidase [Flavobacterium sp. ANB]MTD70517.1 sialidase [Flavobacterium sp. LC2016-13]
MKIVKITFIFLGLLFLGSCKPTLSKKTWKEGILVDEFIYDKAPYPSCHAATIVEATNGDLVASWFGGTHERHPDVCIYVSIKPKGSDKWTTGVQVADGVMKEGPRLPTWNPVLYQIPGGDLMLFYKIGPKPSEWWGVIRTSSDNGKTWSEAKNMPSKDFLGPIKNKPVLLSNGTLMCPSSIEGDGWRLRMETSPDFGKTWILGDTLSRGKQKINAIQPSILFHKDGRIQAIARTRNRALATTFSSDNGKTWSDLELIGLPNNNSGTDAVTLKNGKHLLVYNHVLPPGTEAKGPRTPLNVSVSKDGIHWDAALILEDSKISQYSYPSMIQSSDGMVHIVYTWRREKIKYVKIDPSKLKAIPIKNGIWPGDENKTVTAVKAEEE